MPRLLFEAQKCPFTRSFVKCTVEDELDRLLASGYSREDAMKLIGQAVVREIGEVMTQGKPYNAKRYIKALKKLK